MLVFLEILPRIFFDHFIISVWYPIQSDDLDYHLGAGNSQFAIISPDLPPTFLTLNIFVNIKACTLISLRHLWFCFPNSQNAIILKITILSSFISYGLTWLTIWNTFNTCWWNLLLIFINKCASLCSITLCLVWTHTSLVMGGVAKRHFGKLLNSYLGT